MSEERRSVRTGHDDGPPPANAREAFVGVDGLRLRVRTEGEGPPLLLINGIGAPLELWRPFVKHLPGRRTIAFDLPGSGTSSRPLWPRSIGALADTVAGLQKQLGLAPVDVLGYSLGGVIAQELAHRSPDGVRRLVLCATTPGWPGVPPHPLVIALMLTPLRYYSRSLARLIVPRIAGGRTARDPEVLDEGLQHRLVNPPSPWGYAQQLLATCGWGSHAWLDELPQQTLVIHGDADPVAPVANARRMAARIPNAEMRVLPGAGHLFLLDDSEIAAGLIQDFLERA